MTPSTVQSAPCRLQRLVDELASFADRRYRHHGPQIHYALDAADAGLLHKPKQMDLAVLHVGPRDPRAIDSGARNWLNKFDFLPIQLSHVGKPRSEPIPKGTLHPGDWRDNDASVTGRHKTVAGAG